MADSNDKKELTQELAVARSRMTGYMKAVRQDLDVGARLKISVARNPLPWFAGAAVIGLLLSKIPPMRRKVVVKGPVSRNAQVEKAGKAAVLVTVLKFGLDLAKPFLMSIAKQYFFSGRKRAV